jgi:predicted TIM-barrel fold metal-dependent hydrolase
VLDLGQTEIYVPNEFVAAEVAKHSNLVFGASINPYRPDALERLEWAKAHGAVVVKWLPSIQHIDPADPRLTSFYLKLVELDLPLLSHTGSEHSFTRADDALCDPARLQLPLSCGVRVIAAHAATPGRYEGVRAIDRLAALMLEYPNLYADLSSLTQLNKPGYLGEVIRRPEFAGRILYGSDYPLIEIPALTTAWHYPHRISLKRMWAISRTTNPWDRDVLLKQSLGVPRDVWQRSESVLALANPKRSPVSLR